MAQLLLGAVQFAISASSGLTQIEPRAFNTRRLVDAESRWIVIPMESRPCSAAILAN